MDVKRYDLGIVNSNGFRTAIHVPEMKQILTVAEYLAENGYEDILPPKDSTGEDCLKPDAALPDDPDAWFLIWTDIHGKKKAGRILTRHALDKGRNDLYAVLEADEFLKDPSAWITEKTAAEFKV